MPSRLPKRPGFIGGFQWTPFACELIALPLLQWVVTEIAAYRVFHAGGFFDGLNAWSAPLYAWHGFPIYEPIAWVFWVLHYFKWVLQTHQPWSSALRWSLPLGYGAFLAAMRVPSLLATVMARGLAENQDEIYGSSHWATKKEMKEANLFSAKPGILVGGYREGNRIEYLYDDSDKHALLVAPTGTGKSMAHAIPTVLSYRGSMIVLDIKEEIYCNTAGFRQRQGNVCLKWSPTRKEGCTRINPLAFIRIGTDREVSDAEMVARALCQPGDEGETSTHWNDTSSSVVTGLILHECYQARNEDRVPTLANVSHMLSPKEETYTHLFRRIATYPHDPTLSRRWKNEHGELSPTHPVVADKMVEAWQRGEDEGSSVISTAKKRFSLFSDPLVAYSTSDSDFRIEDLVDGPKPVSLYLVIPPNQQERLSNLVRLITLTLLDRLTEEQVAHKHELLFMLDEFAQLGTLKPMKNALSYVRGYGIRFFLIVQNVGQIVSSYGPNNSIVPNCHIMIAYTPSEYQTAKALSDVLGAVTIQHLSYNVSAPPHLVAGKNLSMHVQNTKRDLLSPDEILRLKLPKKQGKKVVSPGEALILIFGLYPIKGWQTFCFFDPKMRAWMKIRPMDQSKLLRKEVKCIAASA